MNKIWNIHIMEYYIAVKIDKQQCKQKFGWSKEYNIKW